MRGGSEPKDCTLSGKKHSNKLRLLIVGLNTLVIDVSFPPKNCKNNL